MKNKMALGLVRILTSRLFLVNLGKKSNQPLEKISQPWGLTFLFKQKNYYKLKIDLQEMFGARFFLI